MSEPGSTGIHCASSMAADTLWAGPTVMNFAPFSLAMRKFHEKLPFAPQPGFCAYSTTMSAFSIMSRRSFILHSPPHAMPSISVFAV